MMALARSLVGVDLFHGQWRAIAKGGYSRRRISISAQASTCGDGESPKSAHLPPLFSVAPMMDYTDNHYRTLARLISQHAWLYTEMVVADTIIHQKENLDRFLEFSESQHPIVLQIGGSNPSALGKAAHLASAYGYDEINLNCGCPSDKVAGHGCFGASLMLNPELVGNSMAEIAENCHVPVTVKCRIGVDEYDSYEQLGTFVDVVSTLSPTNHFIIHSRKAILKGLSPAANRTVPPLKYEYVFALIRDFPHLKFTLNGGITSISQVEAALKKGAFGVMLGRAAYNSPWSTLAFVDDRIYGKSEPQSTRRQILDRYASYADSVIGKHGSGRPSIRNVMKPLLHLFYAENGAAAWRRAVDEALRNSKSVEDILKETLKVIPDSILDAPPSNQGDHPFTHGELPGSFSSNCMQFHGVKLRTTINKEEQLSLVVG